MIHKKKDYIWDMNKSYSKNIFTLNVTQDGNSYPDEIHIKMYKDEIFKRELKNWLDKYPNDQELGEELRKKFK